MRDVDLLIFTVYIVVVTYILYRAINSIDDQITIKFDQDLFKQQLTEQNIEDQINVQFKLDDKYEIDKLQELAITIQNKSAEHTIYLDWDRSSLIGYDGRSRRVIWLTSNVIRDLALPQIYSVIAPSKTLKEKLTAEDILQRDPTTQTYRTTAPLVSLTLLEKGSKAEKELYNGFMDMNLSVEFFLRLVLRRLDLTSGSDRLHVVDCRFIVNKIPWTAALPWNQKK